MLPELMFPVMQEISRDEFSILSAGGIGSGTLTGSSSVSGAGGLGTSLCENHHGTITSEHIKSAIKLEDLETYSSSTSWKSPNLCNLLRNSEDPLISGGTLTTNSHKHELKPIPESPSPPIRTTPPILPEPSVSGTPVRARKPNRARRVKGQVKLRFHHQALPQKYLEHYESTQNKSNNKVFGSITVQKSENTKAPKLKHIEVKQEQVPNQNSHIDGEIQSKNVRNWLDKLNSLNTDEDLPLGEIKHETELQISSDVIVPAFSTTKKLQNVANNSTSTSSRVYNYNDLPYMGEMTLANSKPRRGRKPKKADICHLIYKNYGQIFPGTPCGLANGVPGSPPDQQKIISTDDHHQSTHKKTNKILSSLLEKRLTQSKMEVTESTSGEKALVVSKKPNQNEPLNLCLRDASPSPPPSSTTSSVISSTISVHDDDDEDEDSIMAIDGGRPLDIANDPILAGEKTKPKKFVFPPVSSDDSKKNMDGIPPPPEEGYIYWPAGKCYIHPMALYYQKMIDDGMVPPTMTNVAQKSEKGPTTLSSKQTKLVAKNISELLAKTEKTPTPSTTPSSVKSIESNSSSTSSSLNSLKSVILTSPSSTASVNSLQQHGGASQSHPKRKRSAIFIPPMPSENTSNPTTEVSICKFKFTGGAKPSLQEKKMLSVDSGGNFRYYSGTGDKSMRGYEFFPRESLQQSCLSSGGSSSGAFLNTPGEKIITEDPLTSLELSSDVLQIPNFSPPVITHTDNTNYHPLTLTNIVAQTPSTSAIPSSSSVAVVPLNAIRPSTSQYTHPTHRLSSTERKSSSSKRKSRRSIQREKLEKTFKEKGFLIQTQQLESAEGATYCKFRQLRRFTRYLFRSWKDYLPGDIQQSGANQL